MKYLFLPLIFHCIFALCANALPITVDPSGPALTGTFAVEWNTNGNLESWTTNQISGANVNGGLFSGTTNGTSPRLQRANFTAGPDLDLGFNDYIELRLMVPANFAGNVLLSYGTTATTSFNASRVITIPNAIIPKDGAFHVYRIDVGPEPWWRSTLRDLRVTIGNGSGVAFSLDYLRVGDLPGDVYLPNTTDQPVTAYELSSKHFRFIWDANRATNFGVTETIARGSLRNAEEAWQTYVKILGYQEPAESMNLGARNGNKYKVNFLCTFDGYWMGGSSTDFGYFNIEPSGLEVDPPTWIIPHELMHVFQMHNSSGHVPGEWWETHANYGRERWLYHYANLYPNMSNIDALAVRDSHFMMSSGRNYYLTFLPFLYMDENPDALPDLYDGIVAKMWQETQAGEFPLMALERLTPTTSLKDIIGYYARRGATFDYAQQAALNAELNDQDATRNARHVFTELVQRADDPSWWRVPIHKAPAQGAYAIHQLLPNGTGAGRVVTVNFRGLTDSARGADWRASLIAVSDTGVERYTPLWSTGSNSITLAANENTLYLSVAGTPNVFHYGGHDESIYRFRSHASRSRFPYEVQIVGATPRERNNGATTGMTQHTNGGGWKSVTVPNTVFIGPNARVTGGTVSGNARIEDYALVSNGTVNGNAIISGHAWVRGGAVSGDARVRDWAIIDGGQISGNARVLEHASVAGNMQDTAVAKGSAQHQIGGTLSGNAIIDGDYMFNKSLSGGVTFGHLPYVGVPDNFTTTTPAGLYAAYDFRSAHDSRALDQYGVIDAYTIGSPTWKFADDKRKGFLSFNGNGQYLALDRSVADSRSFTFTAWVKPSGGPANQAVLWIGSTPTRRLYFSPNSTGGSTKFSIVNGGVEQSLTATNALPIDQWSHIAIVLDGTTGTLYINETVAAAGPITIRPDELLAANTTNGLQHNYLARSEGNAMPMFQGSLDDVQFFSAALSAAQITAAKVPLLSGIGTLLLSDHFNSASYGASAFNSTLANDQQGLLKPITYSVRTGGQDWQAQHGNGSVMLLVGDASYGSLASLNEDFSIAANGLNRPISFQFDAWAGDTGNGDCWASVALGSGQNIYAFDSGAKFGILPKINGAMEVWVNGALATTTSHSGNNYRIVLSDTTGIGSAFNSNGSQAALYNGSTLVGSYTLPQLGTGDGYLSFGANPYNGSWNITRIDNLNISHILSPIEQWRQLHFDSTENTGNAADLFDSNNDGESNLLEFATGQSPHVPTIAGTSVAKNANGLEFIYSRSNAALLDGVMFTVEWSDTLATASWNTAGVTAPTILSDNGITQQIKVTVPTPIEVTRRFAHLRVTRP